MASFSGKNDDFNKDSIDIKEISYREFINDAYNFRVKNNSDIPIHYYEVLGIENPNKIIEIPIPVPIQEPVVEPEPETRDLVPLWVRAGILATESRSYYRDNGTIKYVDKRRGSSCDIGPFQMRRIAFNEIKKRGESFWKLEQDTKYAEEMACRYLLFIYNSTGNKDWERTIMLYNVGPYNTIGSQARRYLNAVKNTH
jgi:hypothetical protein